MATEIERRFLVRPELLPRPLPRGEKIEQGYLSVEPVVRVRISSSSRGTRARLTVKGPGLLKRSEFEYEIPVRDARALLKLCGGRTITKIRRVLGVYEVDEFTGRHRGLWIAEHEFHARGRKLPVPPKWIGKEITRDARYTNARMAAAGKVPART